MKKLIATSLLSLVSFWAYAQESPVGLWQTIDDETGQPKAEIRISENAGVFTGIIERRLDPKAGEVNAVCSKCDDDRKGKPIIGLEIIRGAKQEEPNLWSGGKILDPNNGKSYKLKMETVESGKKLQVRGYIGPFYRTQVWNRIQ